MSTKPSLSSLRRPLSVLTCLAFFLISPAAFARPENQQSEFRERSTILADLELDPIVFEPPDIQRSDLFGGAKLLRAADASLPYVTISLYFEGGLQAELLDGREAAGTERSASPGSLDALLALVETGGAGQRDGEAMAATLSAMGAKLSFESSYEYWSVSLTVLKKDFDKGFALLSDALLRPRLPADRLAIIQSGMLAGIERRNEDPSHIAARKMNEVLFAGTRRGYTLQSSDVQALNVNSLREELNRRLRPGGLYVLASGDLANLKLEQQLDQLIQSFPNAGARTPVERENPAPNPEAYASFTSQRDKLRGRILLVNKPAAQSVIQIAGYLPPRSHADMYALQTGNYILGGGSFNSRLTREIRVRRGLAYYAYSYNDFDATVGRFVAGSGTRSFLAHQTLALMLETISSMHTDVSPTDLGLAKDAILNSLAFQFDSPEDAVFHAFRNEMHGMPTGYLKGFSPKVRALSAGDLSQVARRYLRPEELFIVVAGPAELKEKLETIRPVVVIEPEGLLRDLQVAGAAH